MRRYVADGLRDDKPKKRKPNARLRWHKANHREAWAGLVKLPPEEVGIYWRLILLQYINKAAHLFSEDRELAQACHTELKTFRRVRDKLIERGRIVADRENGIYYDKRAFEEMVEAGFLSDEQIRRANLRWLTPLEELATPPPEPPPKPKPRVVVDNVGPVSEGAVEKLAEVGLKYPLKSVPTPPPSQTPSEPDQTLSSLKCDATRIQSPDSNLQTLSSVPPRRSPLRSGGARSEPESKPSNTGMTVEEWRADQLRRMGLSTEGYEGTTAETSPISSTHQRLHSKAADRKARRA